MQIPLSELVKLNKQALETIQLINRLEGRAPATPEEKAVRLLLDALKSAKKDYETDIITRVAA